MSLQIAVSNDVSAITPQPRHQSGGVKSHLIDLNPEMGTRAKQDFPFIKR